MTRSRTSRLEVNYFAKSGEIVLVYSRRLSVTLGSSVVGLQSYSRYFFNKLSVHTIDLSLNFCYAHVH